MGRMIYEGGRGGEKGEATPHGSCWKGQWLPAGDETSFGHGHQPVTMGAAPSFDGCGTGLLQVK